jgi:hypothetical protein
MVRALGVGGIAGLLGCNALWSTDDLTFDSPLTTAATTGPAGGATSSSTGGTGGAAGQGGGGEGGSGGGAVTVVELGERPDTDVAGVTFDTAIYSGAPTNNYGAAPEVWVDAAPRRTAFLRFDLTVLPAGAEVVAAELVLHSAGCASCATLLPVDLYRLLEAWDEGSGNAVAGVANYDERQAGIPWTGLGAAVGSREDTPVASSLPAGLDAEIVVPLPIELIGDWLADPSINFGLEIETGDDNVRLHTSESPEAQKRPLLRLTIAP